MMENPKIGDKCYHGRNQVTIVAILESRIVRVLAKENGKHDNYDVPISELTRELEKVDVFFF